MAPLPAFAGDNVKVPMTYGEANYFCRRKITMVSKRVELMEMKVSVIVASFLPVAQLQELPVVLLTGVTTQG